MSYYLSVAACFVLSIVPNALAAGNSPSSFEPFDRTDLTAAALQYFVHLNVPPDRFRLYQAEVFPDEPATWSLVRCVSRALAVYNDRFGPDIENLYVQFGAKRNESKYKQAGYMCVGKKMAEYKEPCERAYHTMIGCFGPEIREFIRNGGGNAKKCSTDYYKLFDDLYQTSVVGSKNGIKDQTVPRN